ncbi:MAG: aminotransferase class I/II-fold pyridoxal phosphate-dependent enzyme, partial [Rhodospirillales bacterium]
MTDKPDFLPYGRQSIDDDDIAAVAEVLHSPLLTTGPAVEAFEAALAERTGVENAIACSSGTAALHLAVLALDLGLGDCAVVPAITFLATANAVRFTGADVIFSDVDPDTGLMTAKTFEAALAANPGKRVRAVLPVHLGGQPADPAGIAAVARTRDIAVVEDACHALGTSYAAADGDGTAAVGACRHADMATFSFHPVKTITSGEGGAVTTGDGETAHRLRLLRNHGMTRADKEFENDDLAFDDNGNANPWY